MGFDVFACRLRIVNNSALQQWFHMRRVSTGGFGENA